MKTHKMHRSISSFSSVAPYLYMPLYPRTARHAWTYIFTILRDFFILQHLQRFHITKRRVINVDTAIDEKIPFVPQRIFVYLSFVSFFVNFYPKTIEKLRNKFIMIVYSSDTVNLATEPTGDKGKAKSLKSELFFIYF